MKRGTPDHPKAKKLAKDLNLARYEVVGLLESIWHFAAGYAKRGDIGRFSDLDLAEHLGWEPGSHEALIRKLVEAGWLDRCPCHRLRVHDWPDHADQTVTRSEDVKKRGFLECYGREFLPELVTTSVSESLASQPSPLPLPSPEPMPDPEPVPCAGAQDERRSEPLGPLPPIEVYGSTLTDIWHELRGSPFPQPGPADFLTLSEWHSSGIPIRIVERGMRDCIQGLLRRKDRPAGKPLAYFNGAVREAYGQWRKAIA